MVNRLTVLPLHLLKWRFQPIMRGSSWRAAIRIQRRDLTDHLADNPSLQSKLSEVITKAHGNALITARAETGLPESNFPADCPWSFERIMDAEFWPD